MIELKRTDSEDKDFVALVKLLDAELATRNGNQHSFYSQYNKIDKIRHVVVAYEDDEPVSCGAIKEYEPGIVEVKRMFTSPAGRGRGFATRVLAELEAWASELLFEKCILETGVRHVDAIGLYKKMGYASVANYGQYAGIENSVCFEKAIEAPRA